MVINSWDFATVASVDFMRLRQCNWLYIACGFCSLLFHLCCLLHLLRTKLLISFTLSNVFFTRVRGVHQRH